MCTAASTAAPAAAYLFGTTTAATSSVSGSGCSRLSDLCGTSLWLVVGGNPVTSSGALGSFPTVGAGRFLYLFWFSKDQAILLTQFGAA